MKPKFTGFNGLELAGVSETVGAETVTAILRDSNQDILFATGTTVPTDATTGYAKGCLFIDTDVATGTGSLYLNKGVNTACVFTLVTQA
ncbi:MAG: hypothetical protein EOL95_09200 [Bacteroidia bacterium]|nr:hypothetical protein [Bacteroidia bacterium]